MNECREVSAHRLVEICKTINTNVIEKVTIAEEYVDEGKRHISHWFYINIGTQCYKVYSRWVESSPMAKILTTILQKDIDVEISKGWPK